MVKKEITKAKKNDKDVSFDQKTQSKSPDKVQNFYPSSTGKSPYIPSNQSDYSHAAQS